MTEADWLGGTDPEAMTALLAERGSQRQWRLVAAGCLREVGHLLLDQRSRQAFLTLEACADTGRKDELLAAHAAAVASQRHLRSAAFPRDHYDHHVLRRVEAAHEALARATLPNLVPCAQARMVSNILRYASSDPAWQQRIGRLHCDLLRDLFGNPFRAVRLPRAWLRTAGQQAAEIARAIYADRSFDELSILADALVDADCPCDALVRHCRESGPHGRGCWAVDRLRKK
jgi:hypothetical protein